MKKLKLFFACLLMAVLSIGQVWGAVYFEDTFSNVGNASSGSVLPRDGWTAGSGTAAPQGNSGVRLGASSSGASIVKSAMTSIEGTKSLKVTIYVARYNTNANTLTVTATNGTISALADGSVGTLSEGTLTISPSANAGVTSTTAAATWTDDFKTEFTISGASSTTTITFSSNKRVILGPVKIEDAGGAPTPAKTLTGVAVSGTPTKTSYYAGDNFDPAGLTVTGTYSDESQSTISSGITWAYNPSQELALNQTSIGVTATVSEITSAEYQVSITVTEAPAAVNYELVTNVNDLADAAEIIIVNIDEDKAISTTQASSNRTATAVSSTSHVIAAGDDVQVITLEASSSNWKLSVGEDSYLYASSNSSNQLKTAKATTAGDNGVWAITIANDGAATLIAQGTNGRNNMRYNPNNGSAMFSCYASTSDLGLVKIFKKVDGTVKPSAELSYDAADQKKLTKLGETFTAPTLVNPHTVAVTYASNNTDVAEVAANGAVTIKAAGVAVITASFAGNDDYKAGSASYTIGVTAHAGTEADPYVAADAKTVIDVMGTVENAYATGIVSNVVTTTLPQEGYITFYFSANGATTGQQIEAYKCYGLNSAPFEAVSDVVTGATVVVTGTLKKYNSTYEFDQNCHLVSYTAPAAEKTHIANTKETAYTVAQAITFAADGVTYDLDDYVYVQGVVYDVKSFNNGAMNIFIKDANAENQFELFKCAGINDGNATTPFEALTDVQVGNIVIGYGQLTVYNTTYEFKQGNYLVDLQKPVTGVQLDATAEVEVGSTVNLTATILPSNATGTIVWSVESGDTYASVDENGVVTGNAEGEATIRATVQGTAFYAECTVTITPEAAPVSYDYALVTDAAQLQDGLKVIIVAAEEDKAAGSAAATYRNVVDVERTTDGNYLILDSENMPTEFTLGVSGENFTFNDGDGYMYESAVKSVKVQEEAFEWTISIGDGNIATIGAPNGDLKYNSGSPRFTTYASGQQALQLYMKNDGKQAAGLAWSPNAVELTVGDAFEAPTLTNPNNLVVTITSDNEEVATVSEGVVSLVADATGTAKITASYAGDETYRAASVSYTITVNAVPSPAETKNVVIIAEYDSKFYALTNSISNKTAAAVEVEKDGSNIIVTSAEAKAAIQWKKIIDGENTTFQDAEDNYLKGTSGGGDLTLVTTECNWSWDGTNNCYAIGSRSFIYRESANGFKNYSIGNAGGSDYSALAEVIEIDPENIIVVVPTTHTLSYNPNGGTVIEGEDAIADAQVAEGATVTVAANVYEKDGYLFAGWLYGETVYNAGQTFPMPTTDVVLVAQWTEQVVSDYVLVTDVAQLQAGDKVIIVAADYNVAAGSAAATYRNVVDITKTSDKSHLIFGASMPTEFTLGIPAADEYTFNDGNGYMYESAAKSIKVREDSYSWSISIDGEAIATITGTNALQYNANSGQERFTTYASSQSALQLYRKPGAAPEPEYETVRAGLECGRHYTICLPKKVTNFRGASIWNLEKRNTGGTEVYLEEAQLPFAAGTPFIIQATADKLEVVYEGDATATPVDNGALRGTLDDIDAADFALLSGNIYLLIQNAIRPRTDGNYLAANRAYIDYDELVPVSEAPTSMPGKKVKRMPLQGQTITGCEFINAAETPAKMMINGQLYILRGEKKYDATGRLVK